MPTPDPILIQVPELIVGARLILTAPQTGQGPAMARAIAGSISHLRPWMTWAQDPPSMESAETVVRRMQSDFILRSELMFHLYAKNSAGECGELLGGAGLHRIDWALRSFNLGFWLRASALGQGYATEAVNLLTTLAFEQLQARRVEIRTDNTNLRCRAVAERCGFEFEGLLRCEAQGVNGEPIDTRVYSRIRTSPHSAALHDGLQITP